MVDLTAIKPSERTIEIKHPISGEPIGIRVTLLSMDDDRLKKMKREILDQRLYLEHRGKRFKAEDIEENTRKLLFAATAGWNWYSPTGESDDMPEFEGEVPDYNERNFKRVIAALPWFADQINEELDDKKAFFDNSKSS